MARLHPLTYSSTPAFIGGTTQAAGAYAGLEQGRRTALQRAIETLLQAKLTRKAQSDAMHQFSRSMELAWTQAGLGAATDFGSLGLAASLLGDGGGGFGTNNLRTAVNPANEAVSYMEGSQLPQSFLTGKLMEETPALFNELPSGDLALIRKALGRNPNLFRSLLYG